MSYGRHSAEILVDFSFPTADNVSQFELLSRQLVASFLLRFHCAVCRTDGGVHMSLETQNSLDVGTSLSISQAEKNDWQDKDMVDGVDSPQG